LKRKNKEVKEPTFTIKNEKT